MKTYSRNQKARLRLMAELFDAAHDELTRHNHDYGLCRALYHVWNECENKYPSHEWKPAHVACVHLVRRSLGGYAFLEDWARAKGCPTATNADFFAARKRWAKQLAAACREAGES